MSKTLFKRAAATGATFIAIGSAGAMSLPAVTNAATTHPATSQSAHKVAATKAAPRPLVGDCRPGNIFGSCPPHLPRPV